MLSFRWVKRVAVLALAAGVLAAPLLTSVARAQDTGNLTAAASGSAPTPSPATTATAPANSNANPNSGDTAWMLTSTALVLMMTIPGLALFYGGMVRRKNVIATVAQSFAITALVTVIWYICGYSIAFSTNADPTQNKWWGGLGNLFLKSVTMDKPFAIAGAAVTVPEYVYMMFQMTFAIITPALICGAFAERMKFSALMLFMALWSILVYAPIAHWVWGGGFLGGLGVLDFAGGTVVHVNAGVAGLVCAVVLGPPQGLRARQHGAQ